MSDQFLGEIRVVGWNFAPNGWALCQGQLLSIESNTALFSILGITYGGNGTTNFALPNLQGSTVMGQGQGPGLSQRNVGETGGEDSVTLLATQMPPHTHNLNAQTALGNTATPSSSTVLAEAYKQVGPVRKAVDRFATGAPNGTLALGVVQPAGSGQPHNNLQPYQVLNFVIALVGIYPSQG
jgi:microcystin-dependent protein